MLTSECICTHLRRAARGVSRHYDEALAGFGVNVAQFSLLRHLQRLDRPSITTLAEAMGLERSTLGRNLRVLEADGLVALGEGDDQRNRVVLLTAAGKQLCTLPTRPGSRPRKSWLNGSGWGSGMNWCDCWNNWPDLIRL